MDPAEFQLLTLREISKQVRKPGLAPYPAEQALQFRQMIDADLINGLVHPKPTPDGRYVAGNFSMTHLGHKRLEELEELHRQKQPARRVMKSSGTFTKYAAVYLLGAISKPLGELIIGWVKHLFGW